MPLLRAADQVPRGTRHHQCRRFGALSLHPGVLNPSHRSQCIDEDVMLRDGERAQQLLLHNPSRLRDRRQLISSARAELQQAPSAILRVGEPVHPAILNQSSDDARDRRLVQRRQLADALLVCTWPPLDRDENRVLRAGHLRDGATPGIGVHLLGPTKQVAR